MKLLLRILPLLLCGISFGLFGQLRTFQKFGHKDGLNMASILSLTQSSDGFIWIGSDGSDLVRFDGKEFIEIPFSAEQRGHHFSSLYLSDNELLFSSLYKGFFSYNRVNKKLTQLHPRTDKTGDALHVLRKNEYTYLIGKRGLAVLEKKNQYTILEESKDNTFNISQVIELPNGFLVLEKNRSFLLSKGKVIPLDKWLKHPVFNLSEFRYGFQKSNTLTLFNETGNRWLEVNLSTIGQPFSMNEFDEVFKLDEGEYIISASYNKASDQKAIITNTGSAFTVKGRKLTRIIKNSLENISDPKQVLVDMNGDYWVASLRSGLHKISIEPFTQLRLHPLYERGDISYPYKTIDQKVILSTYTGQTFVGSFMEESRFNEYNFATYCISHEDHTLYYLATNDGVKTYDPNSSKEEFKSFGFKGERISCTFVYKNVLWIGLSGKGLVRLNLSDGSKREYFKEFKSPNNVYSMQPSHDGKLIYIGSNSGIYVLNRITGELKSIPTPKRQGSYSGNSCTDSYGNIWFTMEKGLHVILKDKTHKNIFVDAITSNLFYTLSSDRLGNVIVGTNKGLSVLNVNNRGEVNQCSNYSTNEGFGGYETHMRSQFSNGNMIFVGTIEGFFLINTELLNELTPPLSPFISLVNDHSNEEENIYSFNFSFRVNNSKTNDIRYKYRIKEESEDWINIGKKNIIRIDGLSSGDYTMEVAASYDGIQFSDSVSYPFSVKRPFWQSNGFIILLVLLIVSLNVILLTYGKQFDSTRLLVTKDTQIHIRMTPTILIFSAIYLTGSHIVGPLLSDDLDLRLGLTLSVSFVLITLFFFSLNAQKNNQQKYYKHFLTIALISVTLHYFLELYYSKLHPFHIIGLIITGSIAPYILGKIRYSIAYSFFTFFGSITLLLILNESTYPEAHFIIAIFSSISLLILNSYLRNNSLEKLIFISGIVNRGNMPVIAYTKTGKITYVSENIQRFIDASSNQLLHKNISTLNEFVVYDENYKDVDVTAEIEDGRTYLVPMSDSEKVVRWIEWKFNDFNENLRVIIGQDVSERVEVQNTHDLLVQNVEDLIFTVDVSGRFIFLNDTFVAKMGYTRKELVNTNSILLIPESHREDAREFYANHFKNSSKSSYKELPVQKKNGEIIWVGQFVNTVFVPGSNKYISSYISLARDITVERKNTQLIKEQRDDIRSSINYAKKIQLNLLPDLEYFTENFQEHFIFYRPKDIVSGDFYWTANVNGYHVVALSDCTGHGVPGAFMTVLGINLLNSIVLETRLTDPGTILNELDSRLTDYLTTSVSSESIQDGMELTVVVIDDKSDQISYACSGSRFLINSNGNFTLHKGNNEHIGGEKPSFFRGYTTQYTTLKDNDILYMLTDGLQDQFGGVFDKKYSFRRILELLDANVNLPLKDQLTMVEEEFETWKGIGDQTDDVSLIALKRNIY